MKHLLKLLDCSTEEIIELLNLADQLKYEQKHNISHRHLEGQEPRHDLPEVVHPHPRFV